MNRSSWLCRTALLMACSGFALCLPAKAEQARPAKPMLWKVEGKDLEKPSYLFGTVHLPLAELRNLHPAAERAFTEADIVHTEVPLDAASQVAMMPLLMRQDGKRLDEAIGPELAATLNAELRQISPQFDSTPFQSFKTWAVGVTLPVLRLQLQGGQTLDALLWERATEEGKATHALETVESQLAIFDGFSEEEQGVMLGETLRQLKEDRSEGVDGINDLLKAYLAGDESALNEKMEESFLRIAEGGHKELGDRFIRKVLTERDITLATDIDAQLRGTPAQTHFFAVGGAHYTGKPGIIGHLTEKGYRITRIQD